MITIVSCKIFWDFFCGFSLCFFFFFLSHTCNLLSEALAQKRNSYKVKKILVLFSRQPKKKEWLININIGKSRKSKFMFMQKANLCSVQWGLLELKEAASNLWSSLQWSEFSSLLHLRKFIYIMLLKIVNIFIRGEARAYKWKWQILWLGVRIVTEFWKDFSLASYHTIRQNEREYIKIYIFNVVQ